MFFKLRFEEDVGSIYSIGQKKNGIRNEKVASSAHELLMVKSRKCKPRNWVIT